MPASNRPLLFLDVDGTLIPFGAPQADPADTATPMRRLPAGANPLLARINPSHGPQLSSMPCQLVWATTWMSDANDAIAPLLGLPALPLVDWPDTDDGGPTHWKTAPLVAWAAGRSFVWVDDEITDIDRVWVAANHPSPALLHRVDAHRGLTDQDFETISSWLARL